jgi:hypothetical protein
MKHMGMLLSSLTQSLTALSGVMSCFLQQGATLWQGYDSTGIGDMR